MTKCSNVPIPFTSHSVVPSTRRKVTRVTSVFVGYRVAVISNLSNSRFFESFESNSAPSP